MSRRFDARLKCRLPLTLTTNGDVAAQGVVSDISATHFRAQFVNAISTYKRYQFKVSLPHQQEVLGRARVDRVYPKHADGKYTYIFMIEHLPVEGETALLGSVERGNRQSISERRRADDGPDYGKNRRLSDRDASQLGRPRVVITGIGVVGPSSLKPANLRLVVS